MQFILLNIFLLLFILFAVLSALTLFCYLKFIFLLHKHKNRLHFSKAIKEKINEYWGLNLLRQYNEEWNEIGKALPKGKPLTYWKLTNSSYKILKWFILLSLLLVLIFSGIILFN